MIINTGNRTDIPAYYSKWFFNRIKEGYVYVRNPYYFNQVTKYKLTPDVVDCLAFCTKNPEPFLSRIEEINGFSQFWFVTITPYGKDIEPNVPSKDKVMESFKKLSRIVSKQCIEWRYDPVFINEKYNIEYHVENFEKMAAKLCGYTNYCIISFIDLYESTKRNFLNIREVTEEEEEILVKAFVSIGEKYNIKIKTCLENHKLGIYGVDTSGCMTKKVIERAINNSIKLPSAKIATREGCDCLLGNDIGVYNTCAHGCTYCYANYNQKIVRESIKKHNPTSPFLIGNSMEGDIVKDAKQESYIDGQITFF